VSWVIGVVSLGHELAPAERVVVGVCGLSFAELVAYVLEAELAPQLENAGSEHVLMAAAVAAAGGGAAGLVAAVALLVSVALA